MVREEIKRARREFFAGVPPGAAVRDSVAVVQRGRGRAVDGGAVGECVNVRFWELPKVGLIFGDVANWALPE